jgi:maleylpyruvate isomerase
VPTRSGATIERLEERYPSPSLLPRDLDDRAHVRALAAIVGRDIHPINNRRILQILRKDFGADEASVQRWCQGWIVAGFDALEALLAADTRRGAFCFGQSPSLADVYLVLQVESARRFGVDRARWPRIGAIDAHRAQLEAFRLAAPALQPTQANAPATTRSASSADSTPFAPGSGGRSGDGSPGATAPRARRFCVRAI